MIYSISGYFELPRARNRHIYADRAMINKFWDEVEEECPGLPAAGGCYVVGIRAGKGARPWYVGKAEKQTFQKECLTADKIAKYNNAIKETERGTPIIYFYARKTVGNGKFAKVSKSSSPDVDFLEKMLIGYALDRNDKLINVKDTSLLRNLVVPGLINSPRGKLHGPALEVRKLLGY